MQAGEAVQVAKRHIKELFEAEPITEVGLEEIELHGDVWSVTIGFAQDWPVTNGVLKSLSGTGRTYKIVRIDDNTGLVQSLKHREVARAGPGGA